MVNSGFNISANQANKLKEALKTLNTEKLDYASFTGNVDNIFDTINTENNIFANTGMEEILYDIAGNDKEISDEEIKAFMESNGESEFSLEAFETYAMSAIDNALSTTSTTAITDSSSAVEDNSTTKTSSTFNQSSSTSNISTTKTSSTFNQSSSTSNISTTKETITLDGKEYLVEKSTLPNGSSVNICYNEDNKIIAEKINNPDGSYQKSYYDKNGNYNVESSDAKGNVTKKIYEKGQNGTIKETTTLPNGDTTKTYLNEKGEDILAKYLSSEGELTKVLNECYSDEYMDASEVTDLIETIQGELDCSLEDIIAKGGPEFLTKLLTVTDGGDYLNQSYFNGSDYTTEFLHTISIAHYQYQNTTGEVPSMLQSWYSGMKNDILSKAEDKEMYGKYSYAMGSTTNKAGHYEMTLSEMHKGVEDFNELYNIAYNNKTPKNGTKEDIKNVKNLMETFEGNGIVCNVDPFNMISAIEVLGGESQSTIIRRDTKGFEEYVLSGNLQKTLEQYSEDEMKQKYLEEIFGDEAYTLSPDQLMALDCIYELDKFQAEMAKAYNDIGDDANIWKETYIFKNSEEERNALKVSMTQDYQNIENLKDFIKNGYTVVDGKCIENFQDIQGYIQNAFYYTSEGLSEYQDSAIQSRNEYAEFQKIYNSIKDKAISVISIADSKVGFALKAIDSVTDVIDLALTLHHEAGSWEEVDWNYIAKVAGVEAAGLAFEYCTNKFKDIAFEGLDEINEYYDISEFLLENEL